MPRLGSFIAIGTWDSREVGLTDFPPEDRPPVLIPFFAFRIMVGMGLLMLAVSWFGCWLRWRGRLEQPRWFMWGAFLSFPSGFVAVLTGWFTAEVGRQPWVVYGLLRTNDAVTPSLTTSDVLISLTGYVLVYAVLMSFGMRYIYKLLRDGPHRAAVRGARRRHAAKRPMALARRAPNDGARCSRRTWRCSGPRVIAVSILVYVVLDGFDLGVGILFGFTRDEAQREQMMGSIAPFWDGNETWLVVIGASLYAAFPAVYAVFLGAFYIPVLLLLFGLIFRGVAFEFRLHSQRLRKHVGLRLLRRLDRRRLRAGRGRGRDDARHPGGRPAVSPAAASTGWRPSRCSPGSAWCWAMRCSAPAGW